MAVLCSPGRRANHVRITETSDERGDDSPKSRHSASSSHGPDRTTALSRRLALPQAGSTANTYRCLMSIRHGPWAWSMSTSAYPHPKPPSHRAPGCSPSTKGRGTQMYFRAHTNASMRQKARDNDRARLSRAACKTMRDLFPSRGTVSQGLNKFKEARGGEAVSRESMCHKA